MGKRFELSEQEKKRIQNLYLLKEDEDKKNFCHSGNVKQLDEIIGDDEMNDYIDGISMRNSGVNGLVDKLELLKVSRNLKNLNDNGEHLCFLIMNDLKSFQPYKYYDETRKECARAMDKVIELYREHEHGEELVKDLEKLYANHHDFSPKAREYLKHSINIAKGN